jgi:hypothetical protein
MGSVRVEKKHGSIPTMCVARALQTEPSSVQSHQHRSMQLTLDERTSAHTRRTCSDEQHDPAAALP